MMKVSVQLNVCCRNGTDWCSETDLTTCTTVNDRADIFDAVFGAGIKAGVNVQQYRWGQRNLTSIPRGPIRRQDPEEQNTLSSSYDDCYAACAASRTTVRASILDLRFGDAYDDYGGGGSDDDYEGGDTDDGGGEDDDGEGKMMAEDDT